MIKTKTIVAVKKQWKINCSSQLVLAINSPQQNFLPFFQSILPKICSGEDHDDANQLNNDDEEEEEDNDNDDDEDTMMMTVGLIMK